MGKDAVTCIFINCHHMDLLIGIKTQSEVLLVASKNLARGISVLKSNDVKVMALNKNAAIAYSGEPGDAVNFAEFVRANIQLYGLRHGFDMSAHAAASFIRNELAASLRTRRPYATNILIGGWDRAKKVPKLWWIDYLGSIVEQDYCAHGYAQYYVLSTLDRFWKPNMTIEEAIELAQRCAVQLQGRMPIDFKGCNIFSVGENGLKLVAETNANDISQSLDGLKATAQSIVPA